MKGRMFCRNQDGLVFFEVEGDPIDMPHFAFGEIMVHRNPFANALRPNEPLYVVSHAVIDSRLGAGDTPEFAVAVATEASLSLTAAECAEFVAAHRAVAETVTDIRRVLSEEELIARDLWAIHIPGPDDIYAAPSKEQAERLIVDFNKAISTSGLSSEDLDMVTAVVVPWPDGELEHKFSLIHWPDTVTGFTVRNLSTPEVPA